MPLTPAEKQRRYRERQDEIKARMRAGLTEINTALEGNTKPMAVKIREIVARALA